MLKKRIICTLLWGETGLVKPRAFGEHRKRGSMMDAVRVMERRGVDELVILDITATPKKRGPRFEEIKEFTGEVYCPVTVGGGVTSVEDAVKLLGAGADKVAVHKAALLDPNLITDLARKIGSQSVVMSLHLEEGVPVELVGRQALFYESIGAGEILLVDVMRDGTMEGYNHSLIAQVANNTGLNIPVIASGGCSGPEDMEQAFYLGADACAAGALFQFTEATPRYCAQYLHKMNIPVRIPPPPVRLQ